MSDQRGIIAGVVDEPAIVEVDPSATWYSSADMAAIAALDSVEDIEREHGGVLFKSSDGQYAHSVPAPGTGHNFQLRARFNPKKYSLAGIYHTHPAADDSHLFSPDDIETARKLNLLSFIKVLAKNEIRRFDPAKKLERSDRRSVIRRQLVSSEGDIVERSK